MAAAMAPTYDAVVVGAGHNGLVAANLLADAGWSVLVVEAADEPGGAVRSVDVLAPGHTVDLFSAFYPLGAASPVLRSLALTEHGLRWSHAPAVLAHVLPDDRAVVLSRDLEVTARSVEALGAGDGEAWRALVSRWDRLAGAVLDALFRPFPPVVPALELARRLGAPAELLRFARFALLPAHRLVEEQFRGEGARMLLAGLALHTDMSPLDAGSGVFGWLMAMLAQRVGFPVPAGGSGSLSAALVRRLRTRGADLWCGCTVREVVVRDGRALGVRTRDGAAVRARRAVLADVDAPTLYLDLVGAEHLPGRLLEDLRRFEWDASTLKVNWALSGPVPWNAAEARSAGTVHLDVDLAGLTAYSTDLACGRMPANPFLVLGQMTTADPARSPRGTEVLWGYTHLPRDRSGDAASLAAHLERVEQVIERHAPGFRDLVQARLVQTPSELADADVNLVGGAINGGTAKLHQELVFRPVAGLGRAETPVRGLYLAGASAHPGGGVHGGPGANAARAALLHDRRRSRLTAAGVRLAVDVAYRRDRGTGVLPPPVTPLPARRADAARSSPPASGRPS